MNRTIEQEAAAIEIMKLEARVAQLEAINKQLQEWNKGLSEEILRLRDDKETLATGSFT